MSIHDGHREKMRQRFLTTGLDGFADHEALELLLYYALPRRDTNPIAHALMNRYGSLAAVLFAPVEDLQRVEGIGERAAILLKLTAQLYPRARLDEMAREIALGSTELVGGYLLERFAGTQHERVYQLCLDRKCKLLVCKRLDDGNATSALLDIRKIMENAILSGASAVILAHNHPSGDARPSQHDLTATDNARQALATIGVELLDHIIVADNDYISLADSGYFR